MSRNAEEELEKQYREYKAQFDAWREKNKGSQGTDAYNAYVKQFENWEKDVEKRRKSMREKAEQAAKEAAENELRERERLKRENEERERKQREEQARQLEAERIAAQQRSAAEAAAYAQSQQAYLAHHQKGLEQDHILRAVHMQTATIQYTQHAVHPHPSHMTAVDEVNAQNVLQQMAEVVMGSQVQEKPAVYQQQPPQQAANPPQLWGNTKPTYDSRDPLWAKWGMRAAPAHQPPPPPTMPILPPPYWMVLDALKERKLIIAPTAGAPPPFLK